MDYKYTATFEAPLSSCKINSASLISKASLKNLEPLIPKEIDYNENVDLMGVAFNAAVINQFNKNGDGMDSATAVKYANNFIHKPTNTKIPFANGVKIKGTNIAVGTVSNCAGGKTPWNTFLTCEENYQMVYVLLRIFLVKLIPYRNTH